MEYTNDVIFNVKYKNEPDCCDVVKHVRLHKVLKKIEKDNYFTLTIIISIIFFIIDYLIIMDFIKLVNLL